MNVAMSGARRATWIGAALVGLALIAVGGCQGGCDCGGGAASIPATPQERMDAFAKALPQDVDVAVFLTDMDGVRSSGQHLATRFQGNLPVDAYRQEIKRVLGVDVFDKATYGPAGIHPDGGMAVVGWKGAPVVLFYTSDLKAFEAKTIGALKRQYRISGEPTRQEGSPIKTLKGDAGEFSWAPVDGSLVAIAGASLAQSGQATASPEVLGAVLKPEAPLAELPEFAAFRERVGLKWPASAYVSTPRVLAFYKSWAPGLKTYQKEVLDAVASHLTWSGFGGQADASGGQGQAFFGVDEATVKEMEGLDKPGSEAPRFKVLVPPDAYLFLRTAIDARLFWREYQKLMPPRQQRFVAKIFKNIKASTGIDIENDLINNASGHAGLTLLKVDPSRFQARRRTEQMRSITMMFHLQVRDREAFLKLLDGLVEELSGSIIRQQLANDILRYGFRPTSSTAPPFAIYVLGDLVTVASTELTMTDVHRALTGDGRRLDKALPEGSLSRALLTDDVATGAYLSVDRVKAKLGPVMGSGIAEAVVGPIGQVGVRLLLDGGGIDARGELRFSEPGAAAAEPTEEEGEAPEGESPEGETPEGESPEGGAPGEPGAGGGETAP